MIGDLGEALTRMNHHGFLMNEDHVGADRDWRSLRKTHQHCLLPDENLGILEEPRRDLEGVQMRLDI